jgi:hypothetical protein
LRRSREHELRPATLDHEIMIADIHIALELATREGPIKLITWTEGDTIRDTFDAGGMPPHKVTIQPDAFFQLKDTRLPDGPEPAALLSRSRSLDDAHPAAAGKSTLPRQDRSIPMVHRLWQAV